MSAAPSGVTIIVNEINPFKIHVGSHNSCELLGEFSIFIPKYLLWVSKNNRATGALVFAHCILVVIKPFWNSAKRQFDSLVVGKFKSHPSSSDYLGLILWNCHNRPPLKTFFQLEEIMFSYFNYNKLQHSSSLYTMNSKLTILVWEHKKNIRMMPMPKDVETKLDMRNAKRICRVYF